MEVVSFSPASFDIKLNVNMPLTKQQAKDLKTDLEGLVCPDFKAGIKKKGKIGFHFDSSDLKENPARVSIGQAVLNPAVGLVIPSALVARSYDTIELGIYVENIDIPTKSLKIEEKRNLVFQFCSGGVDIHRKICYEKRVTLNIHLVRAEMNASGSCVYPKDRFSFKTKLQYLFNAFMLFLDPLTRITQSDDTDVVFDELFGRVVTPPVPSVPQVASAAVVFAPGGGAAAVGSAVAVSVAPGVP
jgi:hypothetical protein